MSNGKTIGMILFVGGIILLIAYGIYQGFQEIEIIDPIIAIGVGAIILGFLALLVSIVIEQRKDTKKMKEEISKEDLKP
jgi:multisubunit Na+/H+ antiporter MnhB subunit